MTKMSSEVAVIDNFRKNKFANRDLVFKLDKNGRVKIGYVANTVDDYDSATNSNGGSVDEGEVRVVWHPEGKDQIIKERNVSSK